MRLAFADLFLQTKEGTFVPKAEVVIGDALFSPEENYTSESVIAGIQLSFLKGKEFEAIKEQGKIIVQYVYLPADSDQLEYIS